MVVSGSRARLISVFVLMFCLVVVHITSADTFQPEVPPAAGDYGYYRVESAPAGADVVFDGRYVGGTPVTIPVFSSGSPGHSITVSKMGYLTWTQSYSLNPEPAQTIRIFAALQQSEETGSVKVTSLPGGALVTVDGQQGQMAPWTYTGVSPGRHIVQGFLSGYSPYTTQVDVTAGQTTEVYANLVPLSSVGSLQVISSPPGADLYVDSVYQGQTSLTVGNLESGYHTILLKLFGYQDLAGNTSVEQGKTTILSLTLNPNTAPTTGNIRVSSDPAGAGIYLDMVYQGLTHSGQPVALTGITPGEHEISLKISNYQEYSKTIEVVGGQTTEVSAILTPNPTPGPFVIIEVTSQPSGASVFIDNIFMGITPVSLQSVPAGQHNVSIRLNGYEEYTTALSPKPGQDVLISASLSPVTTVPGSPVPTKVALSPLVVVLAAGIFILMPVLKKHR